MFVVDEGGGALFGFPPWSSLTPWIMDSKNLKMSRDASWMLAPGRSGLGTGGPGEPRRILALALASSDSRDGGIRGKEPGLIGSRCLPGVFDTCTATPLGILPGART